MYKYIMKITSLDVSSSDSLWNGQYRLPKANVDSPSEKRPFYHRSWDHICHPTLWKEPFLHRNGNLEVSHPSYLFLLIEKDERLRLWSRKVPTWCSIWSFIQWNGENLCWSVPFHNFIIPGPSASSKFILDCYDSLSNGILGCMGVLITRSSNAATNKNVAPLVDTIVYFVWSLSYLNDLMI